MSRRDRKYRSASVTPVTGNSFFQVAADSSQGPVMDFDFASLISEMNIEIQEKEVALNRAEQIIKELQEKLSETEGGCEKLSEQVEKLQLQLYEKTIDLEQNMHQNAMLRENIFELQHKANALEDATIAKDSNLQRLETNLHHYQEKTESLKRIRASTTSMIEQAHKEQKLLNLEVQNSKRASLFVKLEAQKLDEDLQKAHRQIHSLTKANTRLEKRLKDAERFKENYEEENFHIRNEITSLKAMVENKTFELIDAQRELASLSEQVAEHCVEDNTFGILDFSDVGDRRNTEISNDMERRNTDLSTYSYPEKQNLLFMLHQRDDYGDRISITREEKRSESEEEEEFDDAPIPDIENKQDDLQLPRVSSSRRDAGQANKDMLVVYLYLTAAAVKHQYCDIDLKTAVLINLGQDMPFWELYPYFIHVFESLRTKNAVTSVENTPRESKGGAKGGGWFSWMKRKKPVSLEL